jgi:ABC-2 type transport system permease protein
MASGDAGLRHVEGAGWRRGLNNHLKAELGRWFRSRKWWTQILIFALAINVFLISVISDPRGAGDPYRETIAWFNGLLGVVGAIGVVILMQGAIVGEKRSGTAAWVLSKPISRSTYLFSKMIGNAIGIAVTIVLAQALISYVIIYTGYGTAPAPLAFFTALLTHMVNLLFYFTLTVMLGAIFSGWGPVIAIPLAFVLLDEFVVAFAPPSLLDVLTKILPYGLATGYGDAAPSDAPSIAMSLMLGERPYSLVPVIATLVVSALFVAVAVRVFRRQAF